MKRTLTLTLLFLTLFWACEKQETETVVAPFMHSVLPESTDTEDELAAYREEFNRKIALCSMAVAKENARIRPPMPVQKDRIEAMRASDPVNQ